MKINYDDNLVQQALTLNMVDIVDTSVDVEDLLPTHGEFITHAVSEALGLREAEKKIILG